MSGALMTFCPDAPQAFVGCATGATAYSTGSALAAPRSASLTVEVTPNGVDVTIGDGTDEGAEDFSVTLNADAARLMMDACAAYLARQTGGPQ
jgi:hypothetical protein